MRGRKPIFLGFFAASLIIYLLPLWALFKFALADATFSYIPLVPLVSAWFFYENRKEIFCDRNGWYHPSGALLVPAILLYANGMSQGGSLAQENYQRYWPSPMCAAGSGDLGFSMGAVPGRRRPSRSFFYCLWSRFQRSCWIKSFISCKAGPPMSPIYSSV